MFAFGSALALAALVGCSAPSRAGFPAPGSPTAEGAPASKQRLAPVEDPFPAESRRVLVVINQASEASREIGEYYVKKRQIPPLNVVRIDTSASETTTFDEYRYNIQEKVREAISKCPNTIDFIVLTKGVPIRLRDSRGYSVDGHLVTMNRTLEPIPEDGPPGEKGAMESAIKRCLNPFFGSTQPFSSKETNLYLVTRLDGYEMKHMKALVDNSLNAKAWRGPFFFDAAENRKTGGYEQLQKAMAATVKLLKIKGFDASIDETPTFVAPANPLAGYCSWGSNDGKFVLETYRKLRFRPGAIAETFVSTSGRTFSRTEGGQSLIADLIEQGVTGVKGYVSEPFTFALSRPELLFDRYTGGFNLAESFYASSPVLKWKDVVIGDPICRPYGQ